VACLGRVTRVEHGEAVVRGVRKLIDAWASVVLVEGDETEEAVRRGGPQAGRAPRQTSRTLSRNLCSIRSRGAGKLPTWW